MLEAGKMVEIEDELKKYNIQITALQEEMATRQLD
jgi:hypothetical protein